MFFFRKMSLNEHIFSENVFSEIRKESWQNKKSEIVSRKNIFSENVYHTSKSLGHIMVDYPSMQGLWELKISLKPLNIVHPQLAKAVLGLWPLTMEVYSLGTSFLM